MQYLRTQKSEIIMILYNCNEIHFGTELNVENIKCYKGLKLQLNSAVGVKMIAGIEDWSTA